MLPSLHARDNYCIFNISLSDKRSAINLLIKSIKPSFLPRNYHQLEIDFLTPTDSLAQKQFQ